MNYTSQILQNIDNGEKSGIISFNEDKSRITYHCNRDYQTSFKNPEEKVRASYFVELVQTYQYPQKRIDIEITVPRRTPEDRADIVVYSDDEYKEPFLVVECKKEGITDAEFKQAIEQAFGNANSIRSKYASVVAGNTKTAFDVSGFKPNERERNVIADIPLKYGKAPKYKFIKGDKTKDLKVVTREDLISALEKCHDTVWQGGKLAPTTAFDEVSKLLFCKMKDEKDGTKRNEPYSFQIGTHETADEVAKRINEIYQEAKKQDEEVFKEDIRLEPKVIYSVVEHLQGLALNKTDLDTKGVAFEKFMIDYFKGKMGQFFTPRPIIEFAVKLLSPKHNDLVIDPSCGSGGFLLAALDTVRNQAILDYGNQEGHDIWHSFAKKNLYGIEINDQIARICKMNMIIHDDGHTNVINTDSLDFFKNIKKIHKGFKENNFDLLLANPPFGATVRKAEKEEKYLEQYKLGEGKQNQKTEILFIERCLNFIKKGTGRMGLVLPDGILTNSTLSYVRDFILENCQILGVVSIPQFAFTHFGAGVKSSLVFLRRKEPDEILTDYEIFMANAEKIGYEASGTETPDENDLFANSIIENDEDKEPKSKILDYYKKFESQTLSQIEEQWQEKIFILKFSEIESKLDVESNYKRRTSKTIKSIHPIKSLGEISDLKRGPFGGSIKKEIFVKDSPENYQVYEQYNAINNDPYRARYFISPKDYKRLEGFAVSEKDILMSCSGTIGKLTIIPENYRKGVINQALLRIRLTDKTVDFRYFKIVFSKVIEELISGNELAYGGVIKNIASVKELKEIKIPIPPIEIQIKMANDYEKATEVFNEKIKLATSEYEKSNKEIEKSIFG